MKRTKPKTPPAAAEPAYRPLQSFAELEKLCDVPVVVEVLLRGERVRFEGRRLTPDQTRQVKTFLELALPPELPPDPDDPKSQWRYDLRNPDYLKTKEENRCQARALALYYAFPLFRTAGVAEGALPPERTPAEIVAVIQNSRLDDLVLDCLYAEVMREIVAVDPRRVGFTSGSSSLTN